MERLGRRIRVLLVEEQEIVLRGLAELLRQEPAVELLGAAPRLEHASLIDASAMNPDVVLASGDALDAEALSLLRHLTGSDVRLLLMLKGTEPAQLRRAARLRADGYVLQLDLSGKALGQALIETHDGRMPMPPPLATFLLGSQREIEARPMILTPREAEALVLIAQGKSNKQIALALGISSHGAKHHVANLFAKLRCSTRAAAVAIAAREGLLKECVSTDVTVAFAAIEDARPALPASTTRGGIRR